MRVIDVEHLGRPHVIGCWQVGEALVDPGPESSLQTLLEALGDERPRALLLTHIHLDHAAATGALVRRWPELEVYVHERGAPHMVDPSRLLASAERLYGEEMERLWGEIVPVPEQYGQGSVNCRSMLCLTRFLVTMTRPKSDTWIALEGDRSRRSSSCRSRRPRRPCR